MPTPHIAAERGEIAKDVLMPGDPLRAQYIAENFLENPKLISTVRNIYAYTGNYRGKEISVMASGMGMPSIGIYSYELYKFYDVEQIIRIGSAGSYIEKLGLYSLVLADSAYSNSSFAYVQNGDSSDVLFPDAELNNKIRRAGEKLDLKISEGRIYSGDIFYFEKGQPAYTYYRDVKGCLCTEMEAFALFSNAKILEKKAACLLTISDSFVTNDMTTAEERQNAFTNMMKVALEAVSE